MIIKLMLVLFVES